jgi:hypothetical protein
MLLRFFGRIVAADERTSIGAQGWAARSLRRHPAPFTAAEVDPAALGKKDSNRTDRFREIPLGVFQRIFCKPAGWMPDQRLSSRAKDRHVSESTKKRTSGMQTARAHPIRHRFVAARLHDHRHIVRRREGNRRVSRHSAGIHNHIVGRPSAPMSAGMANRLRAWRSIHRLDRKVVRKHRGRLTLLGRERELGADGIAKLCL